MMSKKSPDQLLYEATRNASQRPLLNRLEALEITRREQQEYIAELKAEIKRLRQEITWLGGYPPEWEKDDE